TSTTENRTQTLPVAPGSSKIKCQRSGRLQGADFDLPPFQIDREDILAVSLQKPECTKAPESPVQVPLECPSSYPYNSLTSNPERPNIRANVRSLPPRRPEARPLSHSPADWYRWHGCGLPRP